MKFYIGDRVRILRGCKILEDDSRADSTTLCSGKSAIFVVSGMKKFSGGRFGITLEGYTLPVYYDKHGLELVERGPNFQAHERKKKGQNNKSEDECMKTPCCECVLEWLKQEVRNNA